MKVTTDGCLFGAIVAKDLNSKKACRVLDIGTGTGLLSLIVAQENDTIMVDAIEIDEPAAKQAKENAAASPWSNRIYVCQQDVLNYHPAVLYHVIICNPPFYEQQLSSPIPGRQLAHHSTGLTLQHLFVRTSALLEESGKFYLLLPFYRMEEAITIARQNGFFVEKQWLAKQTSKHPFFRTIFCFCRREHGEWPLIEIIIREEANNYSEAFTEMLYPFYLHL